MVLMAPTRTHTDRRTILERSDSSKPVRRGRYRNLSLTTPRRSLGVGVKNCGVREWSGESLYSQPFEGLLKPVVHECFHWISESIAKLLQKGPQSSFDLSWLSRVFIQKTFFILDWVWTCDSMSTLPTWLPSRVGDCNACFLTGWLQYRIVFIGG